jgi:broad specificity phosphatase PhoE
MHPDLLITSTYERAAQTARVVGASLGVAPIYKDFFREVERPSSLSGRSLFHPRTLLYMGLTALHRNNPRWRFEDAENFSDIYARVERSLAYIESLMEEHDSMVVVSHSAFTMLMILYMCHSQKLSIMDLLKVLLNIRQLRNCNIAHVEYNGPVAKGACAWLLHRA